MTTTRIQFTDWLPDQPANAGSLNDAKNVYPLGIGYGAFPSAVDFSNAASETLNSVFVAKFGAVVEVFAGSATKLYKLNIGTLALADVSKSGGYSGDGVWRFEQFGNVVEVFAGSATKLYNFVALPANTSTTLPNCSNLHTPSPLYPPDLDTSANAKVPILSLYNFVALPANTSTTAPNFATKTLLRVSLAALEKSTALGNAP